MAGEVKKTTNTLGGETAPTTTKKATIFDVIKQGESQFKAALPKHLNSERFVRIAMTAIRLNPKLAGCKKESLLGTLMTAAQLGLEPGPLGQCYLIPYGNECQFQLSYKGMIELLRRSNQLSDIYAYTVNEKDEFKITYGLERNIVHIPNFTETSKEIGYYAVAILKDGTKAFEYMPHEAVEKHGKRFSKTYSNGPWKTDFEAMAHKTVIKKLLKLLPVSVEFIENLRKDEKTFNYKESENKVEEIEILDDFQEINGDTGEIISTDSIGKEAGEGLFEGN